MVDFPHKRIVVEGYGPNNLLDRITGDGWTVSRSGFRHFHGFMADGNAVLLDKPHPKHLTRYRAIIDTIPSTRYPVIIEGWQTQDFLEDISKRLRLAGVMLRQLAFQELDDNVSAYRVTCEVIPRRS